MPEINGRKTNCCNLFDLFFRYYIFRSTDKQVISVLFEEYPLFLSSQHRDKETSDCNLCSITILIEFKIYTTIFSLP